MWRGTSSVVAKKGLVVESFAQASGEADEIFVFQSGAVRSVPLTLTKAICGCVHKNSNFEKKNDPPEVQPLIDL
jgi:hypothetical protein